MATTGNNHKTAAIGREHAKAELEKRGVANVRIEKVGRRFCIVGRGKNGTELTFLVKSKRRGDWQTSQNEGEKESLDNHFWLLVHLAAPDENRPDFYVVPDQKMRRIIKDDHDKYIAKHDGRRPVNPRSQHHRVTTKQVEHFKEQWGLLPTDGDERTRYWAILANPTTYRIQEAVATLKEDTWNLSVGNANPGDRLLIWKAKGKDQVRGVVGLAEVLESAAEIPEYPESDEFWAKTTERPDVTRRIRLRYVVPPRAPLWQEYDFNGVLEGLTVAKAQGSKLYKVTTEQWDQVVEALGGWPDDEDSMRAIAEAGQDAEEASHARSWGQGYVSSPQRRKAIEMCAMKAATEFFEDEDYKVKDTSANRPYDLVCTREGELLYVEVKGTTTGGEKVILTKNEVEHAQAHQDQTVLFILHDIKVLDGERGPVASGGIELVMWEWSPSEAQLTALSFQCKI